MVAAHLLPVADPYPACQPSLGTGACEADEASHGSLPFRIQGSQFAVEGVPGKPVACIYGPLWLIYGLLRGVVA